MPEPVHLLKVAPEDPLTGERGARVSSRGPWEQAGPDRLGGSTAEYIPGGRKSNVGGVSARPRSPEACRESFLAVPGFWCFARKFRHPLTCSPCLGDHMAPAVSAFTRRLLKRDEGPLLQRTPTSSEVLRGRTLTGGAGGSHDSLTAGCERKGRELRETSWF